MILDTTTRSIVAVLGAVKTTNDCAAVSTVIDSIQQKTTPILLPKLTNGTVEVTLVSPPAANTARLIKEITLDNADTIDQTAHISMKDGSTYYHVIDMLIPHGRTLQFQDGYGWFLVPIT